MAYSVAYCIDQAYALPLAVSVRSVLEHWDPNFKLEIFILHSRLDENVKEKVLASLPEAPFLNLHWELVDEQKVAGLSTGLHFSSANYFRLLLPELLPELKSFLYLDADTVARSDLSDLFRLYDKNFPLQACQDYTGWFHNPLIQLKRPEDFAIDPDATYYNSGVLLVNAEQWRADKIGRQVLDFGRLHPETLFLADQTAINIVLRDRIGRLASEWNTQTIHPNVLNGTWNVPYIPQNLESAKIVHYTSEWKPWTLGKQLPSSCYFHEILARTAWQVAATAHS